MGNYCRYDKGSGEHVCSRFEPDPTETQAHDRCGDGVMRNIVIFDTPGAQ